MACVRASWRLPPSRNLRSTTERYQFISFGDWLGLQRTCRWKLHGAINLAQLAISARGATYRTNEINFEAKNMQQLYWNEVWWTTKKFRVSAISRESKTPREFFESVMDQSSLPRPRLSSYRTALGYVLLTLIVNEKISHSQCINSVQWRSLGPV